MKIRFQCFKASLGATAVAGILLASSIRPAVGLPAIDDPDNIYVWPAEDAPHEATWLQWPHDYGWDPNHVKRYEPSWVELVKALHEGEKVQIIVYDRAQKRRVKNLLRTNGVDMGQVGLFNYPTDDVWIRDNGPIFAFDKQGNMVIEDWKFNGWVSDISSTGAAQTV
jgi:agmatine deiminase